MPALQPLIRHARVRAPRGVVCGQSEDIARSACAAAAAYCRREAAAQRAHAVQSAASAR